MTDLSSPAAAHALLVGATGLVGSHVLDLLLDSSRYDRVTVLARRPLERAPHPKLEAMKVDFDALAGVDLRVNVDHVYVALGTTIKVAGSQERFRRVDHDYVVESARLGQRAGAARLGFVSSIGAAPGASNFYLRVKGETERDLEALRYTSLELLRPSILLGERRESRPGERLAIAVTRPLTGALLGPLRMYRPIEARVVARAMVAAVLRGEPGVHVRTYDDLVALAR